MAALPPRKNGSTAKTVKKFSTPLQILLQMGFPKNRAEKALAATGERGVQLAADWLLAHVNDQTLDTLEPREYIVYLCPSGPLADQLQQFWSRSLMRCGRNGAHNQLPHITLCSFFKVADEMVGEVVHCLRKVAEMCRAEFPERLQLERYTSSNFIGLFVAEEHAEMLRKVAVLFAREMAAKNIVVEASTKSVHLTLAYQFEEKEYAALDELARGLVDPAACALWEMRLYSRDPRVSGHEVHKVIYSHLPQNPDELELLIGDFVFVDGDQLNRASDDWVEGTSWLNGCDGVLPKNYIERTAESDAYTLHRSVTLTKCGMQLDELQAATGGRRQPFQSSEPSDVATGDGSLSSKTHAEDPAVKKRDTSTSSGTANRNSAYDNMETTDEKGVSDLKRPPRKVIVSRHGERVDFTFGTWIPFCFDDAGNYIVMDLNMPNKVPKRKGIPQCFQKDCPLTETGLHQATLTGLAMKRYNVEVNSVYCSPALRCVQTCTNILKALELSHLPINIEPGLFEWLAWYPDSMPEWMTIPELKENGYKVSTQYKPLITVDELHDRQETSEQYYMRSYYVTQSVLKATSDIGGSILLVGHAATLDACTRQLCGHQPRSSAELTRLVHKISYCGIALAEEGQSAGDNWKLVSPQFPPLTHSGNMRFDWKVLL